MITHRWCPKCESMVPVGEYKMRPNGTYQSYCIQCKKDYYSSDEAKAKRRAKYAEDKAKYKKRSKDYLDTGVGKLNQYLNKTKKNYGLTESDIVRIMDSQRGCCAICGDSLYSPDSERYYHVDHDHESGEVRGFLCHHCNLLLGNAKDDVNTLSKAIFYLLKER